MAASTRVAVTAPLRAAMPAATQVLRAMPAPWPVLRTTRASASSWRTARSTTPMAWRFAFAGSTSCTGTTARPVSRARRPTQCGGTSTSRSPRQATLLSFKGARARRPEGIYDHMVVMPGAWEAPSGTLTCSSDPSILASAVSVWVAQAASWSQLEKYAILNIGNEWGPSNSTVWRDSYISAIGSMRAAGYHATLSITSGGCGQDNADLVTYAKAVFDSDPEKNVIFDRHVYGGDADVSALSTDATALAALGLPDHLRGVRPGKEHRPLPHRPDSRAGHPDRRAEWFRMARVGVGRQQPVERAGRQHVVRALLCRRVHDERRSHDLRSTGGRGMHERSARRLRMPRPTRARVDGRRARMHGHAGARVFDVRAEDARDTGHDLLTSRRTGPRSDLSPNCAGALPAPRRIILTRCRGSATTGLAASCCGERQWLGRGV